MVQDTYLLMGHKLLVIDNNYQNTEIKEWIAFHVMIVWLLAWLRPLCCAVCYYVIAVKRIHVGHNIDDCDDC